MRHENRVFVVDTDAVLGVKLAALLDPHNTSVQTFPSAEDFLLAYEPEVSATYCALIEADLPGMSGVALLQRLRALGGTQPVIFIVDSTNRELRLKAMQAGATVVIEKPVVKAFLVARLAVLSPGENFCVSSLGKGLELRDGTLVTFRMMHPEDAEMEQRFVRDLSPRSKQLRFFSTLAELSPSMLEQFTHPHYPESYALIATIIEAGSERQIAVVRYEATQTAKVVEYAIAVADAWQGFGLASEMLRGLIAVAAVAGIARVEATILRENHRMLTLVKALGFTASASVDDSSVVYVAKQLRDAGL